MCSPPQCWTHMTWDECWKSSLEFNGRGGTSKMKTHMCCASLYIITSLFSTAGWWTNDGTRKRGPQTGRTTYSVHLHRQQSSRQVGETSPSCQWAAEPLLNHKVCLSSFQMSELFTISCREATPFEKAHSHPHRDLILLTTTLYQRAICPFGRPVRGKLPKITQLMGRLGGRYGSWGRADHLRREPFMSKCPWTSYWYWACSCVTGSIKHCMNACIISLGACKECKITIKYLPQV